MEREMFEWQEIGEDDFICNPTDDYSLRVERMTSSTWWWAVYFKDKAVFTKKRKCHKMLERLRYGVM